MSPEMLPWPSQDCAPAELPAVVLDVHAILAAAQVVMPSGEVQDLWTADPWLLTAMGSPDTVSERREGPCLHMEVGAGSCGPASQENSRSTPMWTGLHLMLDC
jgi:hypothetical protein